MVSNKGRAPIAERFGRYVYLNLDNGCWEWRGAKSRRGYGVIFKEYNRGKEGGRRTIRTRAHRLSYQIFRNTILTASELICHKCDNPPCVNPDHLFVGTQRDNMADMIAKGRNGKSPIRHGEANCNAKLTKRDVLKIRQLSKQGLSSRKIARLYSVDKSTILAIINHETWRHI